MNGMARSGILAMITLGLAAAAASGPVLAEVDLTGMWMERRFEDEPERGTGPSLVEYQGTPINESARQRALSWDPSLLTLPEYQCRPHPADYGIRHSHVRFWKEVDASTQQVIAWRSRRVWQAVERRIVMDNGRVERPADHAAHTWQGFSVASWEGDVLTIETTHLKQAYLRRNGIPRSDKATLREHLVRNGDYLTFISVINDPVYFTEPMIRSSDYQLDMRLSPTPYPCEIVVEVTGREPGAIPHLLPGTNPFVNEYAERVGLPLDAVLGGAHTMYPEYLQQLRGNPIAQR